MCMIKNKILPNSCRIDILVEILKAYVLLQSLPSRINETPLMSNNQAKVTSNKRPATWVQCTISPRFNCFQIFLIIISAQWRSLCVFASTEFLCFYFFTQLLDKCTFSFIEFLFYVKTALYL